jgi:hypothetical protein
VAFGSLDDISLPKMKFLWRFLMAFLVVRPLSVPPKPFRYCCLYPQRKSIMCLLGTKPLNEMQLHPCWHPLPIWWSSSHVTSLLSSTSKGKWQKSGLYQLENSPWDLEPWVRWWLIRTHGDLSVQSPCCSMVTAYCLDNF